MEVCLSSTSERLDATDTTRQLFRFLSKMATTPAASAPAQSTSSTAPKVARSARGRPSDDPTTRHSKTLSYILRHGAAKEYLVLRKDGFVRVDDLVRPFLSLSEEDCG